MYINFIILPFIILLGLLLPNNDKNRKVYIVVIILIFLLESTLRSLYLVADTYSYYEMFKRVRYMYWSEIWDGFVNRYFGVVDEEFDFGYYILQKVISYITNSFQVFTFLSQLFFFIPMGVFLYKYSTNNRQLIFAFVFFVALLQVSAIGGGRQLLARGCWIMAFMLINDSKFIKGALWILLGLTFHFSILAVLLAVALSFMKSRQLKKVHFATFLLLPLVFLFPTQIIMNMAGFIGSERYAGYGEQMMGGAFTFIILMELLSFFCYFMLRKNTLFSNVMLKKLYVMLPCITVFAPLIIVDGVMIRLSSYFHMFLMLLVPYAIEEFKDKKTVSFVYTFMIAMLVFLTLKDGGLEYYFFWQDVGYNIF